MLVSGVFGLAVARLFASVIRFFPPLVAGTVIVVFFLNLLFSHWRRGGREEPYVVGAAVSAGAVAPTGPVGFRAAGTAGGGDAPGPPATAPGPGPSE